VTTPTWKEQFGRILIEAMACGVPVVGSSSGEIPQVIGTAGLVVPEGDAEALAAALQRLHDDTELRTRLGQLGRQRVLERYTHERIAHLTHGAYACTLET
jgi:glycosyltransferase involved in cell wall biosynthesis